VPKHWITDREDPRTVLVVCVIVLAVGLVAVPTMMREGGITAWFSAVWLVLATVQVIWATARLHRWRTRDRE
jgi:hypothetical protein